MQICILTHRAGKTGGGRYVDDLARVLEKNGHRITLLTYRYDFVAAQSDWKAAWQFFWQVRKAAHANDIVHAIDVHPFGIIGFLATRFTKAKFVITAQGTYAVAPLYNKKTALLARLAYRGADAVIAISNFTKAEILKKVPQANIVVINHGIDLARFPLGAEKKYAAQHPLVIGVGSLKPRKGFHISLEAIALAQKTIPDIRYCIVGSQTEMPEYFHSLQKQARDLGIEKNVSFLGSVTDAELRKLYQDASLFMLTAINDQRHFEGFGLVFLEAAAQGVPSIGTLGNGIEDAVADGKTGILVPQHDAHATADALVAILQNKEHWEKMSARARQWATDHDWALVVKKYEAVYRDCAENTGLVASKEKWNSLAKQNARYFVLRNYGEDISEEKFRDAGREEYAALVADDVLVRGRLGSFSDKKVLEIGCGLGRLTEFLAEHFQAVVGVDISEEMIRGATERLRGKKNVMLMATDGRTYPLADGSVDFVFSYIVFQHMPDKATVAANLREVFRVLRPGGIAKIQLRGAPVRTGAWFYGPSFSHEDVAQLFQTLPADIVREEGEGERYYWVTAVKKN
jgi:glycosyltransferase involved in cell wall biosynthesis/SAM-dependent methyltransferase